MGRILDILAPLLLAGYLCALWSDWFSHAELSARAKRPLYSEYLDLRKVGPVAWRIPEERLGFATGTAHLSLSLNLNALREIPQGRKQIDLRLRVSVEGRSPGGEWEDRLVRNDYFRTDEPFAPAGKGLWESYGLGRLEYGLAAASVNPGEELRVTLEIQVPDGRLMTGRPRLKLVAQHGPGDVPYPAMGRQVLREGGFWLAFGAIGWLASRVWMRRGKDQAAGGNRDAAPNLRLHLTGGR